MKLVNVQKAGRWYRMQVPDDAPEAVWQYGVVVGPPDLTSLGLPPSIEVRLHSELYVRGLISKEDIRRRMPELTAALQAAFRVDAQRIAELYEDGS